MSEFTQEERDELLEALYQLLIDTAEDEALNEASISIPYTDNILTSLKSLPFGEYVTDNGVYKIFVRDANSAVRGKMATSESGMQHSASIKLYGPNDNRLIIIPTKSFEVNDNETRKDFKTIENFVKTSGWPKKAIKTVLNFIFDNQMLIIALWYANTSDMVKCLTELCKIKFIEEDYANAKIKPKRQLELNNDKKDLNEYVRKELNDPSIELYFGEQKKSKEEKKADNKKKRK